RVGLVAVIGHLDQSARGDVEGGEEAVLLVVEELVEGLPRDARPLDHVDDASLGIAELGDHVDGGGQDARSLLGGHLLAGEAVPSARQSFELADDWWGRGHRDSLERVPQFGNTAYYVVSPPRERRRAVARRRSASAPSVPRNGWVSQKMISGSRCGSSG